MKKIIFMVASLLLVACNKFLEIKPDRSVVIPETVQDIRAMLDYQFNINEQYPGLTEMIADDYFLDNAT